MLTFVSMSQRDAIVFFDGVCNFCNGTVNWLMARNKRGNLSFSSLQGKAAQTLLPEHMVKDLSSIVYYRSGKCYTRSSAVIRIVMDMAWYGKAAALFLLVPAFIRDHIYGWIARNRYRWFGKREACRIPTKEERARFID